MLDSKELHNMVKFVPRGGNNVVDDHIEHQGERVVFLNKNSIVILEEHRMLMMIMTHLTRDFKM